MSPAQEQAQDEERNRHWNEYYEAQATSRENTED
jgi:hypothetical protein